MPNVQIILHLAAEGGGLKIFGIHKNSDWLFRLVTNDHTPTLLDEDPMHEEREWVKSLPEALSQIRWKWNRFSPIEVHSAFAAEILKIKLEHDKAGGANAYVAHDWERLCMTV